MFKGMLINIYFSASCEFPIHYQSEVKYANINKIYKSRKKIIFTYYKRRFKVIMSHLQKIKGAS